MAMYDLTSLEDCKLWLGYTDDKNSALLCQQITQISSMVMSWLDGPSFLKKVRNEYYNGKGTTALMLRNFPVLSVNSVAIGNVTVPVNPTPPVGVGWFVDPWDGDVPSPLQSITLNGYQFFRGQNNILVNYVSGYVYTETGVVVPANMQYVPLSPQGLMVQDNGVTYANGTALVAVKENPTVGQYVPPTPLNGTTAQKYYLFNTTDVAANVTLTYSFVPSAVQMVVTQLVGERVSYQGRIGLRTKSLGGQETMSYDINTVPKWAQMALQPFTNVVPVS